MGQIVDLIVIKSPIGRGFISRYEELIPIHSSKGDWIKAVETRAIRWTTLSEIRTTIDHFSVTIDKNDSKKTTKEASDTIY